MRGSKADIKARHNLILAYLSAKGKATIEELAEIHGISQVTIRRDLEQMSKDNLIVRTHGGASINTEKIHSASYIEKDRSARSNKQIIADYVAGIVPEGSTIFCNSGTTICAIMERLEKKNVVVVTNNTHIFPIKPDVIYKVVSTGGSYNHKTESFVGDLATRIVSSMTADMCILGASAVNADFGVSTNDLGQPMVNSAMAENCKGKIILAVDGKKIGKKKVFRSLTIDQINIIVTDHTADIYEVERLEEAGIEVIFADEKESING